MGQSPWQHHPVLLWDLLVAVTHEFMQRGEEPEPDAFKILGNKGRRCTKDTFWKSRPPKRVFPLLIYSPLDSQWAYTPTHTQIRGYLSPPGKMFILSV